MVSTENQTRVPLGTYKRVLDRKFRLSIPGILREPPVFIDDMGYITLHRPGRLLLLPHDFVKRIMKPRLSGYSKREREAFRNLLISLQKVFLDKRGRVSLPGDLVGALNLATGDTVIITVSGGWVEIWPEKDWEKGKLVNGLFKF